MGEERDTVSSRDGSNRTGGRRQTPLSGRETNPARPSQRTPRANWDVDPAEIDRYLSGRPSREQESQATSERGRSRRSNSGGTAGQLDQLQRARGSQPFPRRTPQPSEEPQRTSRPPSVGRQQFVEPDYADDEYYDAPEAAAYDEPGGNEREFYDDYPPAPAPQSRLEQPSRRQAQPSRQSRRPQTTTRQPLYEDEYDEELYADDPYLTYDEDDDWQAPAPRRSSRPRPQVRLNKPNLPKLSVPTAISQSELANDIPALSMIGGAILSAAIMAIVVSNRLDVLPLTIPTHVSASGVAENIQGRNAIWSLPLLTSALSLMNIAAAWFFARIDMFAARFMLGASLLVQFIAWVAVLKYLWP